MENRFWIGVVSQTHIATAVEGGFAQLNHGKKALLSKLSAGDWLVYYSPRLSLQSREPYQQFTAIGQIKTGEIYQHDIGNGFLLYHVDVDYLRCQHAAISALIDELSFTKDKENWGQIFRRGYFEISENDFKLLVKSVGAIMDLDAP